jgi:hypothetical protein
MDNPLLVLLVVHYNRDTAVGRVELVAVVDIDRIAAPMVVA